MGVEEFKKAEEAAILSLDLKGTVIATGGSVVYSPAAMAHLKSMGKVIYMHLSFAEMENALPISQHAVSYLNTARRCLICITSVFLCMKNMPIS